MGSAVEGSPADRDQSQSSTTSGGSVPMRNRPRPPASLLHSAGVASARLTRTRGPTGRLDEAVHPDPQGVGQAAEGGDVRVGPGLLDGDDGALGHRGPLGQGLQGHVPPEAQAADVAAEIGGQLLGILHGASSGRYNTAYSGGHSAVLTVEFTSLD